MAGVPAHNHLWRYGILALLIAAAWWPALTHASEPQRRALWSWLDSDVLTAASRKQMLDFAVSKDISVIYVHSQTLLQRYPTQLKRFINRAATRNISVELLFGDPQWTYTSYHQLAINLVLQANNFINSLTGAKPVGLHFDVEAHALPEWADPGRRPILANQLLTLYEKLEQAKRADLYINADIALGYKFLTITRNGATKTLSQWLVDTTDRTTIMSYRDYALGADSITDHASHPVAYAATKGKIAMVGVETTCNQIPPKVSFCEEGSSRMEGELDKVATFFSGNIGYGGQAIHDYKNFSILRP